MQNDNTKKLKNEIFDYKNKLNKSMYENKNLLDKHNNLLINFEEFKKDANEKECIYNENVFNLENQLKKYKID